MAKTVAYVRVSSIDQNPDRQLDAVGDVDRVFTDKISGKSREGRDQLAEMVRFVRDGDTVLVASMDRLGRDVDDLKTIIKELNADGVSVHLLKENLRFDVNGGDTAMTDLMLHLLGGVAQFERERIKERQREGIAAARARGAYTGRPAKLSAEQIADARERRSEGVPVTDLATEFGVSRQTLYSALKA